MLHNRQCRFDPRDDNIQPPSHGRRASHDGGVEGGREKEAVDNDDSEEEEGGVRVRGGG